VKNAIQYTPNKSMELKIFMDPKYITPKLTKLVASCRFWGPTLHSWESTENVQRGLLEFMTKLDADQTDRSYIEDDPDTFLHREMNRKQHAKAKEEEKGEEEEEDEAEKKRPTSTLHLKRKTRLCEILSESEEENEEKKEEKEEDEENEEEKEEEETEEEEMI
jgi:hypothetical protein